MNTNKKIGYGLILVSALAAPLGIYPVFLMKIICFALVTCTFDLLINFTGLLSFWYSEFFRGAGYVTGYALQTLGLPTELGLILETLPGTLISFIMGSVGGSLGMAFISR